MHSVEDLSRMRAVNTVRSMVALAELSESLTSMHSGVQRDGIRGAWFRARL